MNIYTPLIGIQPACHLAQSCLISLYAQQKCRHREIKQIWASGQFGIFGPVPQKNGRSWENRSSFIFLGAAVRENSWLLCRACRGSWADGKFGTSSFGKISPVAAFYAGN